MMACGFVAIAASLSYSEPAGVDSNADDDGNGVSGTDNGVNGLPENKDSLFTSAI
jgi:hypothetical protein